MKLCVLSCCYEKPELASILKESCEIQGLPLVFCEAAAFRGTWSGSMRVGKLVAAREALPGLANYTHVLWADGFDSFVQADEQGIFDRLDELGNPPMVFSAEKNCWPDQGEAERYPKVEGPYRYINAGTWMGTVEYLRFAVETALGLSPDHDDQRLWTQAFLGGHLPGAVVDSYREIFQTMWGTELEDVADSCVIHYNGGIWRNPTDLRYVDHWAKVKKSWEVAQ